MTATVLSLLLSPICKAMLLAMVLCSVGAFVPERAVRRCEGRRRHPSDAPTTPDVERSEFGPDCDARLRAGDGVSNVYEWEMVSVNS